MIKSLSAASAQQSSDTSSKFSVVSLINPQARTLCVPVEDELWFLNHLVGIQSLLHRVFSTEELQSFGIDKLASAAQQYEEHKGLVDKLSEPNAVSKKTQELQSSITQYPVEDGSHPGKKLYRRRGLLVMRSFQS